MPCVDLQQFTTQRIKFNRKVCSYARVTIDASDRNPISLVDESRRSRCGRGRDRIASSCTVCIVDEFIFVDIPKAPVHGPMNFGDARLFPVANFAWELPSLGSWALRLSSFRAKPWASKNSLHSNNICACMRSETSGLPAS